MGEYARSTSFTIGATSTVLSEPMYHPSVRKALVIVNTSTGGQIISIAFGGEAVAGSGIVLAPYGEWSETLDSRFTPSQDMISAISSAAGGTIGFHERIMEVV